MEQKSPDLIAATKLAFERMRTILFRPFDLGKWFLLGFTAWLATLMEGGGSSGGSYGSGSDDATTESFSEFFEEARTWVMDNLELILMIGSIVIGIVIVIGLALTWVRSRGKFMFLDNVVHNRALVSHPWREFRKEGNSLFFWTLVYGFLVFLLIAGMMGGALYLSWPMIETEQFNPEILPSLIALGVGVLLLGFASAYILMLLENFVVPLMYRNRENAVAAWRKVLSLHSQYFWQFVLFFVWVILLGIGTGILLTILILVTCCIAGIVLAVPYLGAVLMLPITVFFRALGPEFLRQLGDASDLFGSETPAPAALPGNPST